MDAYSIARREHLIPPLMQQPEYNMFHRQRVEREYMFSSVMLSSVQRPFYFGGERSGSARRVPHVTANIH
jgi:hypothetical protein